MPSLTTGLTAEMSTYYDKVFLARAEAMQVYDVGAKQKTIAGNMGKTVSFTRRTPLSSVPSTALVSDEVTSNTAEMTSTSVTASVSVYSKNTKVSQLFSLTSIDEGLREHVEVHGQNAGEIRDTIIRDALDGNCTNLTANSVASASIAASDTIDGADVRRIVRTLKLNKAPMFSNGMYKSVIPVSVVHDLRGDSEWLDAYKYTDASLIRNGQIGKLHGVEFFETNNEVIDVDEGAGAVDNYSTFFFGDEAYATISLANQAGQRVFVKNPGEQSTDNPANLFSTVAFSFTMAAKVLNADWIVQYKSASSVGTNA